jgi:hypothetical protein
MLEMVRNDVHQFEYQGLVASLLTEICAARSAFFCRAIHRVENCHASQVGKPH